MKNYIKISNIGWLLDLIIVRSVCIFSVPSLIFRDSNLLRTPSPTKYSDLFIVQNVVQSNICLLRYGFVLNSQAIAKIWFLDL